MCMHILLWEFKAVFHKHELVKFIILFIEKLNIFVEKFKIFLILKIIIKYFKLYFQFTFLISSAVLDCITYMLYF